MIKKIELNQDDVIDVLKEKFKTDDIKISIKEEYRGYGVNERLVPVLVAEIVNPEAF